MATKKKTEPLPSHEEDPILKCGEVGRQLGIHRSTIWLWAKTGLLEAIRMPNGHVGVRQSQVNKILKASAFFEDKQVSEEVK
jgi:predicted site-specific integrase-resolvase